MRYIVFLILISGALSAQTGIKDFQIVSDTPYTVQQLLINDTVSGSPTYKYGKWNRIDSLFTAYGDRDWLTPDSSIPTNADTAKRTGVTWQFDNPLYLTRTTGGPLIITPAVQDTSIAPDLRLSIADTENTGNSTNNSVFYLGWNIDGGGNQIKAGVSSFGMGIEHHFEPTLNDRYSEWHEIFGDEAGVMHRLRSYTIDKDDPTQWQMYYTLSQMYCKDPTNGLPYYYVQRNGTTGSYFKLFGSASATGAEFFADAANTSLQIQPSGYAGSAKHLDLGSWDYATVPPKLFRGSSITYQSNEDATTQHTFTNLLGSGLTGSIFEINTSGGNIGATQSLLSVKGNAGSTVAKFAAGGDITFGLYPNTRDDTGVPTNILTTSAAGVLESHSVTDLTATFSDLDWIKEGTASTVPTNTENMFHMAEVGINTNTPSEMLDVNGNINVPTTSSTVGQVKVNGTRVIHFYGTNNSFLGKGAGNFTTTGSENTGIGEATLVGLTSGSYNNAFGFTAGNALTTGNQNTAFGRYSLGSTTTGSNNVAIGNTALYSNVGGSNNTAIGLDALRTPTGATQNIAIGNTVMYNAGNAVTGNVGIGEASMYNTTGDYNTAIGFNALTALTSGTLNTAIGRAVGSALTSGSNNVIIGEFAGAALTTQSTNTFIGTRAGFSTTGGGNVFIGNNAGYNETGANKLYIDNSNSATPLIKGDFDADTLRVNGDLSIRDAVSGAATDSVLVWTATTGRVKMRNASAFVDTDDQNLTIDGAGPTYDIAIDNGTDVTIAGAGIITLSETPANTLVITGTEVDGSITNEIQTLDVSGTSQPITFDLSSDASDITLTGAGISVVSASGNAITVTSTEVDGSTTNEGQWIIDATTGGTETVANQEIDFVGAGINTTDYNTTTNVLTITGTEVDGSTTNEAWTIDADDADTELISNQTVKFEGLSGITTNYVPATNTLEIELTGGGADGNGIYDGSGTVPTATTATLTDGTFKFQGGTAQIKVEDTGTSPAFTLEGNIGDADANYGSINFNYTDADYLSGNEQTGFSINANRETDDQIHSSLTITSNQNGDDIIALETNENLSDNTAETYIQLNGGIAKVQYWESSSSNAITLDRGYYNVVLLTGHTGTITLPEISTSTENFIEITSGVPVGQEYVISNYSGSMVTIAVVNNTGSLNDDHLNNVENGTFTLDDGQTIICKALAIISSEGRWATWKNVTD